MALVKSKGNMYSWVTHMHSHLGGECPHKCSYCYVQKNRFGVSAKYQGKLRLITPELLVNYGSGKTIFIEHMNDLFSNDVPERYIRLILGHCRDYPDNSYVFQTKNPQRVVDFADEMPEDSILGVTIETNRSIKKFSKAPDIAERVNGLDSLGWHNGLFLTIEPIMRFDLYDFLCITRKVDPEFINIGADSKGSNLPEPSGDEIMLLVEGIEKQGIVVKEKHNLNRLLDR
jgi:DNA repair photolyase